MEISHFANFLFDIVSRSLSAKKWVSQGGGAGANAQLLHLVFFL